MKGKTKNVCEVSKIKAAINHKKYNNVCLVDIVNIIYSFGLVLRKKTVRFIVKRIALLFLILIRSYSYIKISIVNNK